MIEISSQERGNDFRKIHEADHNYPITKLLWAPFKGGQSSPDLLATTGDYLRIWDVGNDETTGKLILKATLANVRRLGPVILYIYAYMLYFFKSLFICQSIH